MLTTPRFKSQPAGSSSSKAGGMRMGKGPVGERVCSGMDPPPPLLLPSFAGGRERPAHPCCCWLLMLLLKVRTVLVFPLRGSRKAGKLSRV